MTNDLANKFARLISTLFVPPSFTIIVFTVFAFTLEVEPLKRAVMILTSLILGFISPIVLFVILRNKNKLADLDASVKEERTLPFLIAALFYTIGLIIFIIFQINIISIAFWFCYISNTLLTIFINKHWKISAHSMGAAGPLAAVIYVIGPIAIIFSLLVFLIGWSRIQLKVHDIAQVAAGILIAFISTYLQMFFIAKWFQ